MIPYFMNLPVSKSSNKTNPFLSFFTCKVLKWFCDVFVAIVLDGKQKLIEFIYYIIKFFANEYLTFFMMCKFPLVCINYLLIYSILNSTLSLDYILNSFNLNVILYQLTALSINIT